MQAIVQILKFNEVRSGEKNGRKWSMQDCECLLLDENGKPDQVGVLVLPKDLMERRARGELAEGIYTGSFALRADTSREGQRRINAALVGLTPVPPMQPRKP